MDVPREASLTAGAAPWTLGYPRRGVSELQPPPPRFVIVRARGDDEVVGAIDGRVRRGERIGVAINPCAHRHYALVLINDARLTVLVSGHDAEVGDGVYHLLALRRSEGSEVQLSNGAQVIALFSDASIDAGVASALAAADDAHPTGLEVERVTLTFED
jgi:hypothetical protein